MTFRTLASALTLFVSIAGAQTAPIRVLASNGVKAVVEELQPQSEKAIGHPLSIQYNSTASLQQKIEAGEPFDVAVLTSEAIAGLVKTGKVAKGTSTELARCGVGVGVRAGAEKPDIHSSEALKRTLLEAKSVAYAEDGASKSYIDKMLERLGIASELKAKALLTKGSGPALASVAAGKTSIVMTLISEILPVPGVQLVGPFPAELQNYVSFAAGAGGGASNSEAAKSLIAFFAGQKAAPVYKARGLEPPNPGDLRLIPPVIKKR
jgi:molybdate transport system substrate-binding protein